MLYQLQNVALRCIKMLFVTLSMPLQCTCGKKFTVEHALSCSHGGYPSIRDITAELLSEICHNVGTEPSLQPITDEHLIHRTANRDDGARLDVASGVMEGNAHFLCKGWFTIP